MAKTSTLLLLASCALSCAWTTGASARQHYGARYYYPPEEDRFDVPEAPVGFVFMRHSERCEYPNGWSSADFSRNVNGIPRSGRELLATGCGTYAPLAD
jgi:hypothetical protein